MLNTNNFKEYVRLYKRKQELDAESKKIKEELDNWEQSLVDSLVDNEMDKISIAGKTCYLKLIRFAKVKSKQEALEVLKNSTYSDFVTEGYNTNSINKLVRDLYDENGELPDEFGEVIQLDSKVKIGVTNA